MCGKSKRCWLLNAEQKNMAYEDIAIEIIAIFLFNCSIFIAKLQAYYV